MDAVLNLPFYLLALLALLLAVSAIALMVFIQRWNVGRDLPDDGTNGRSRQDELTRFGLSEVRPVSRSDNYQYSYDPATGTQTYESSTQFEPPSYQRPQPEPAPVAPAPVNDYHTDSFDFEDGVGPVQPKSPSPTPAPGPEKYAPTSSTEYSGSQPEIAPSVRTETSPSWLASAGGEEGVGEVRPKTSPLPLESILRPLVRLTRTLAGCQTVAVLSYRDGGFEVESGDSDTELLQRHIRVLPHQSFIQYVDYSEPLTVLSSQEYMLSWNSLGYYRGDASFTHLAVAPVSVNRAFWGFLVADCTDPILFEGERVRNIFKEMARLLGIGLSTELPAEPVADRLTEPASDPAFSVLEEEFPEETESVVSIADQADLFSEDVPDSADVPLTDQTAPKPAPDLLAAPESSTETTEDAKPVTAKPRETKRVKLRREVIFDQMVYARRENVPLAFLLVCLNDKSRAFFTSDGESTDKIEGDLLAAISEILEGESRAERFGELMFGVFFFSPLATAETWIEIAQGHIASSLDLPEYCVSIGAVFTHNRHKDGQAVLDEAIAALNEVYTNGGGTIYV